MYRESVVRWGLFATILALSLLSVVTDQAAFVLAITVHEASHAFTALRLGDPSAYLVGHVALVPRPHMRREPFGTVIVPILSYIAGGWMIGWASVPYDFEWALRHPRRHAWMSLAGPAANLALGAVAVVGADAGAGAAHLGALAGGRPRRAVHRDRVGFSGHTGPAVGVQHEGDGRRVHECGRGEDPVCQKIVPRRGVFAAVPFRKPSFLI